MLNNAEGKEIHFVTPPRCYHGGWHYITSTSLSYISCIRPLVNKYWISQSHSTSSAYWTSYTCAAV